MAIERRTALLVKKESTYGVDPSPSPSTDAIEIFDFDITPNIDVVERTPYKESISPEASLPGKKYIELSFYVEIKGNGIQQNGVDAPRYLKLLEGCGIDVNGVDETSAGAGDGYFELRPKSSNFASLTFYAYLDDTLYIVTGARGSCSFDLEANQIGKINFKFVGKYNKPQDTTFPSVTYEELESPFLCKSAGLTMGGTFNDGGGTTSPSVTGGYAPILSKLSVDLNNDVKSRDDLNDPSGVGDFAILSRGTNGSLDPDAMKLSDYDIWQKFENGEQETLWATVGNTAGNIFQLFIPKAVYNGINTGARDGIRTYETNFTAVGNDDEIIMVFK